MHGCRGRRIWGRACRPGAPLRCPGSLEGGWRGRGRRVRWWTVGRGTRRCRCASGAEQLFLAPDPGIVSGPLRRVRQHCIGRIDRLHHARGVAGVHRFVRVVFLCQRLLGGADHLGRSVSCHLEVVVMRVQGVFTSLHAMASLCCACPIGALGVIVSFRDSSMACLEPPGKHRHSAQSRQDEQKRDKKGPWPLLVKREQLLKKEWMATLFLLGRPSDGRQRT